MRNDVAADVDAAITNITVSAAGNVNVTATGSQAISAMSDATASSSGGSAMGEGDSIAANASIVTNTIQGDVDALVKNSSITTTASGDLNVLATNSAVIDAINKSAITTGDTGVGVTIAYNTLGYEAQNILFKTLNAIIGTDIGLNSSGKTTATVRNTPLHIAGDVAVKAWSDAKLTSKLTNETVSAASALIDATGMAVGTVLASNMVGNGAAAVIDFESAWLAGQVPVQTIGAVKVAGSITVDARDRSGIDADTQLDTKSTTTNDGGVSTAAAWAAQFLDNQYDFTSLSGTKTLGAVDYKFTSAQGSQELDLGTRVLKIDTDGSQELYRFVGTTAGQKKTVDLSKTDFSDSKNWERIRRRFTTTVRVGKDHSAGGVAGKLYRFIGPKGDVDLGTEDYSDIDRWERIEFKTADFIPNIGNISDSDSMGVGVLVVRNDSRSDVNAGIDRADLKGLTAASKVTSVTVSASEQADLRAVTENRTESSGGSAFGEGTSLAVGTTVVTNTLLSAAASTVTNSRIDASGNVTVDAENRAGVDATANTAVSSGDQAVGAMLAFNTLGYESQNVLFNSIDALLQTNIGKQSPSRVDAVVRDTPITAGGNVTVTADNEAALNATISNAATSAASALVGAGGSAASILVTSNMVATDANATIETSEPATPTSTPEGSVSAGGDLKIDARDRAEVYANTKLVASSVTTNDAGVSVLKNTLKAVDPSSYNHHSTDGSQNIKFGETVRLASDHTAGGNAGSIYKFMGSDQNGVALGDVDYSDIGFWQEVSATKYIPDNLNVDDSDSMAIGALFVRNDVQASSDALLKNTAASVTGEATVNALEDATIHANINSEAESSGGSAFGTGTSLAANVVFATNVVQSSAEARVDDSSITTTGLSKDINVTADNTAYHFCSHHRADFNRGGRGNGNGGVQHNWLAGAEHSVPDN